MAGGIVPEDEMFDGTVAFLLVWFIAGIILDGHGHLHDAPITFFTPEHAVFYTAFAVMAAVIGIKTYGAYRDGDSPVEAIPDGYAGAALGIVLFGAGGVADMLWHGAFGIETTTEALYSPSHLTLAIGAVLLASGPFQAVRKRDGPVTWRGQLPLLVSAATAFSLITFMTMYAHPVVRPLAAVTDVPLAAGPALPHYAAVQIGMLSMMLQGAVLGGLITLVRDEVELVPGAVAFIVAANTLLMAALNETFYLVPGVLVGAIAAEVVLSRLDDSPVHVLAAGFLVPSLVYMGYFAGLAVVDGIAWSVHLWTGAIALSGIAGLLAAFLFVEGREARVWE